MYGYAYNMYCDVCIYKSIYIYIYVCMYVCMYVCVFVYVVSIYLIVCWFTTAL